MNLNIQNFPAGACPQTPPPFPVRETLRVSLCPHSLHYTSQLFELPPLLRIPGHALEIILRVFFDNVCYIYMIIKIITRPITVLEPLRL